ncbi:MAG: glycosyltransferase family protein [Rhodospirillales bacterium]|nr:glycosyltransferase family protein [Rhodospirillales bacterium]MCW9001929.1 glycosyltransferase family protein [Rhodospirillales bacterium]
MTITAAIIQARMGSSRLPGKVMMPLAGKTVLAHVLERCGAVRGVDVVCCATTNNEEDDAVVEEARRCGAEVFRGSADDVLDRFNGAAKMIGAGVVMRVTSDCPLADPDVCAAVIALRAEHAADYACNNMPPMWPHGLDTEVFTVAALLEAAGKARDKFEREHVTPWMRNNPDYTRVNLPGPGGGIEKNRWTIDYPEDYAFFQAIFAHLPPPPAMPGMEEILSVINGNPEIAALNRAQTDLSRYSKGG